MWVEKECCQELLQHLLLGFELDCYLPNEFCMLYWYVYYLPNEICMLYWYVHFYFVHLCSQPE